MNYQEFVTALFEEGKKIGFEDMEVYYQKNSEFETTVFKAEVDKFSISEVAGLSFRGIYNGKMGYAFTEALDEAAVTMLVTEAKDNASVIESKDIVEISSPQTGYKTISAYGEALNDITKTEKINFLKEVEKEAMAMDSRIQSLAYNLYADSESSVAIENTKGMKLNQRSNLALAYIMALAVDGNENKTGGVLVMDRDFKSFDAKRVAKEVVEKTVSLLGAKSIASKSYPVVLKNECAASLLGAFQSVFNAEIVQKDLSMMKGLLDKSVASSAITLVDDPFLDGGFGNRAFDAEGTPTSRTEIIKDGVLKSYLHNNKTAKKDGIASTGNAAKGSYKSSINIAPSNFFIEPGSKDFDALIADIDEGMIITKLEGLHSGLNTISGDFSLAALGYFVKNGKVDRPVDQITVAGNLKVMLKDIEAVGSDIVAGFPHGSSFISSPSLKVKSLAIAGN